MRCSQPEAGCRPLICHDHSFPQLIMAKDCCLQDIEHQQFLFKHIADGLMHALSKGPFKFTFCTVPGGVGQAGKGLAGAGRGAVGAEAQRHSRCPAQIAWASAGGPTQLARHNCTPPVAPSPCACQAVPWPEGHSPHAAALGGPSYSPAWAQGACQAHKPACQELPSDAGTAAAAWALAGAPVADAASAALGETLQVEEVVAWAPCLCRSGQDRPPALETAADRARSQCEASHRQQRVRGPQQEQQGLRTQRQVKVGMATCSGVSAMQQCIEASTSAVKARCAAYGPCQHKAGSISKLQQPQIDLAQAGQCLPQMCKWAA